MSDTIVAGTEGIVLPIIHHNGTSANALIDQLEDVYHAVDNAIDAMRMAWPNGRDYYPVPGRLEEAEAQAERRVAVLVALYDEIEAEINAIAAIRDGNA